MRRLLRYFHKFLTIFKLSINRQSPLKVTLGFTLIELIIVISLISFLSVTGIAAFVQYNSVQSFNGAVQDVATLLQTAKANASSQVKPAACTDSDALHGFRVALCGMNMPSPPCVNQPPGGDDYQLQTVCGGNDYIDSNAQIIRIDGKKLPSGVTFKYSMPAPRTNRGWFLFRVLNGGVSNSSESSSGRIVLQDTMGHIKSLIVNSSGTVTIN